MVRAAVRQVEDWTATWFDIWPVRVDEFLGEIFSPKLLQMLSEWLTDIMSGCICQGIIQYGGNFHQILCVLVGLLSYYYFRLYCVRSQTISNWKLRATPSTGEGHMLSLKASETRKSGIHLSSCCPQGQQWTSCNSCETQKWEKHLFFFAFKALSV